MAGPPGHFMVCRRCDAAAVAVAYTTAPSAIYRAIVSHCTAPYLRPAIAIITKATSEMHAYHHQLKILEYDAWRHS